MTMGGQLKDPGTKQSIRSRLARRVYFSCGHRYYQPKWSDEENRKVYGSLYSPNGFGHNFCLEAFFEGPVDPVTGMVVNLRDVDEWLKAVTQPLDHHFLNDDVPFFKHLVPTVENIARFCFEELQLKVSQHQPQLKLFKVRLYESDDLWIDYAEEPGPKDSHGIQDVEI